MSRIRPLLLLALVAPLAAAQDSSPATADEATMMQAVAQAGAPGPQHAALARMAGTYDVVIRSWFAPGRPPVPDVGTATRSMTLGGRVMVEEMTATMGGQPFTGRGMHGYDNVSGRHWATWNDSMSTGVMVSDGTCDAAGACTFTGSWNDPMTRGRITARMTSRWTAPDVERFEMFAPGPDGKETKMMEIVYTRR